MYKATVSRTFDVQSKMHLKTTLLLITFLVWSVSVPLFAAAKSKGIDSLVSTIEYQQASQFTHLNWHSNLTTPTTVKILPIVNRSGIPIEAREENTEYFEHGKIPLEIDELFKDLINSSRTLLHSRDGSDYTIQLVIDQYQLPFDYAPDDVWWQDLHDQVDRWLVTPKNARISLTLILSSSRKHISTWRKNIKVALASCDLNKSPQSLTSKNNDNELLRNYSKSTIGQSFIAASNFLILQAIHQISSNGNMAKVDRIHGNELLVVADGESFGIGEKLALYHNNQYSPQSRLPAGEIQVIKAYENQALAYPVDIRADQIKIGDWVKLNKIRPFPAPKSLFRPLNQCTKVDTPSSVATAN